ncbi:MAG: outer membrane receptor for ferrienterochelin and colicin [Saprospiraceae bacterium]|jgi:outer membrane receptor for ferrienterochelin and colicin
MKKIIYILIFSLFACYAGAQSPLDVRLYLKIENQTLDAALVQLLENEEVSLSFSNSLIPKDWQVTVDFKNARLEEILDGLLLGTDLNYQVFDDEIVLTKIGLSKRKITISGFVEDRESGEYIVGANVFAPDILKGTTTNEYGFYSFDLPSKELKIVCSFLGYEREMQTLNLTNNLRLDFSLKTTYLSEIVVVPARDSFFLKSSELGVDIVNMHEAAILSGLGGETDVIRVIHTLPGVQTGADGFGNISVRGGNGDQNLFLLDGVPIYNSTHAVGLFSVYNSSAIRSARFYKGVFPAKFGGRISSVLDVQTREGNRKKNLIELEMGLTSGKLTVEGPIKSENTSFFISGRRTFFDFYSVPITSRQRKKDGIDGFISYLFFDLNAKINHRFSDKDRIYLSFYKGGDSFLDEKDQTNIQGDTLVFFGEKDRVDWGNTVSAFRWNHIFNSKLFSNTTLTFTQFFYDSETLVNVSGVYDNDVLFRDILFYKYQSNNLDLAAKIDFDYRLNERNQINFGASLTQHKFQPGVVSYDEAMIFDSINISNIDEINKVAQKSTEYDFYIQDEIRISRQLRANLGLRLTALNIDNYWHVTPQPRVILDFFPENKVSFHLAGGLHTQNIHLLNTSSFGLPKDLWVSATKRRKPQQSWQSIVGVDWMIQRGISFGIEGYYKNFKNIFTFPEVLLDEVNSVNWQGKVSEGTGKAYGVEFLLKKETGKTTGWLSYTLGKSTRIFEDEINRGEEFPIRLDRRHVINLQLAHQVNKKWSLSMSWVYGSGSAFTLPTREYILTILPTTNNPEILQVPVRDIEQKNGSRLPDYHRLDLSGKYSFTKGAIKHTIKIGTFNTYNRRNPIYRVNRDRLADDGSIETDFIQVTLLPVFPSLRYTVLFY